MTTSKSSTSTSTSTTKSTTKTIRNANQIPRKYFLPILTVLVIISLIVAQFLFFYANPLRRLFEDHDDNNQQRCQPQTRSSSYDNNNDNKHLLEDKITIIIMTYKRTEVLIQNPALTTIVPLECVHRLLIIWNDVSDQTEIPWMREQLKALGIGPKVQVHVPEVNSMNNRFITTLTNGPTIETQGIFYLDDEWKVDIDNFNAAYEWWKLERNRLVGFLPRKFTYNFDTDKEIRYDASYKKSVLVPNVNELGYNMLLPGGGLFIHKRYIDLYSLIDGTTDTRMAIQKGRSIVDREFNCDDMLINFIIPPIHQPPRLIFMNDETSYDFVHDLERAVKAPSSSSLQSVPSAISDNFGLHVSKRRRCIHEFYELFGWPLKVSHEITTTFPPQQASDEWW